MIKGYLERRKQSGSKRNEEKHNRKGTRRPRNMTLWIGRDLLFCLRLSFFDFGGLGVMTREYQGICDFNSYRNLSWMWIMFYHSRMSFIQRKYWFGTSSRSYIY